MTAVVHIRDAIDLMAAERSSLVVIGRAMSPSERRRLDDLEQAINLLNDAVTILETDDGAPEPPSTEIASGRYNGIGADAAVDIRVDRELDIISGDIYAVSSRPASTEPAIGYAASFRTVPGERLSRRLDASHAIFAQDDLGGTSEGTLQLASVGDDTVCTVELRQTLNGLPGRQPLSVAVEHRGELLRSIGIEIDREDGVDPIGPVDDGPVERTIESVLEDAGLDPEIFTPDRLIPSKPGGWDTAELHALMVDVAERPIDRRAWALGLLVLGRADQRMEGLLGVMFDTTPHLPRQAAAVFATTIRERRPADAERKLIQTTAHELGHALNLAHRFEREVGRADSFSHMAYDWRHRDGPSAFWAGYDYTFDHDELEFLRHGRRRSVIPGGEPFHSVRYWADGDGGYSPYVPEVPLQGISLRLDPPPAVIGHGGPVFEFGQPVFLQVSLRNDLPGTIEVAPQILDHKIGLLEVLIRRHRPSDPSGLLDAEPFVPIVQRCVDIDPGAADAIPSGGVLTDNLNLTFGAGGFGFAEPGLFDVTAVLAVPEVENGEVVREYIVASPPLRISVAHPTSRSDNESVAVLMDPEVGAWFALGGSPALPQTGQRLADLAKRRGDNPSDDPVVAAIVRTQMFEATRSPIRFDSGTGTFTTKRPDETAVGQSAERLDDAALGHFDRATAASTRRFTDGILS